MYSPRNRGSGSQEYIWPSEYPSHEVSLMSDITKPIPKSYAAAYDYTESV